MIFVIGSRGRLGKRLCEAHEGQNVIKIGREVYQDWWQEDKISNIQSFFDSDEYDQATLYIASGIIDPNLDSQEIFNVNYALPKNIILALQQTNMRVVTFGTIMENLGGGQNNYIQSKIELARFIANTTPLKISCLHVRIHTLYGDDAPSRFMFLGQIVDSLALNTPFEMTSGLQFREYHHIQDDINAIDKVLHSKSSGIIDINHGDAIRLKDLATEIFTAFGKSSLLKIDSSNKVKIENYKNTFERPEVLKDSHFRDTVPAVIKYVEKCLSAGKFNSD